MKPMFNKKVYLSIFLFTISVTHYAYSEQPVTWEECVREAKENNPELMSAAEKVKQAKRNIDIDISATLPQVDSDLSGKRSQAGGKKPANAYSYGMTGSQLVFDGFKTSSEISNSMKLLQAEEYNYDVTSSNIRLNLRNAFASLMRAQGLIFITEDIAKRRKQNLELVKLRYEGGREHRGALLTAEADVAQAEFDIAQAKRGVVLSQRELCKELGFSNLRPMKAAEEFLLEKDYSVKPVLDYMADTTPFLRELISKKEASKYNLNSKEADFFPKVYVSGSLGKTDSSWPPGGDDWSGGFSVSLPLFEGGRRIAETKKARSAFRQAKSDERSGRDSVLVTLERTWKNLQDAITNVSVQKKFLLANEERAKITRAQYSNGLTSFNDWIIIEDNLVKSQKAYLNAQAEMLVAEAYWIQAIGGTLEYDE